MNPFLHAENVATFAKKSNAPWSFPTSGKWYGIRVLNPFLHLERVATFAKKSNAAKIWSTLRDCPRLLHRRMCDVLYTLGKMVGPAAIAHSVFAPMGNVLS